jgi:hypothetical protein
MFVVPSPKKQTATWSEPRYGHGGPVPYVGPGPDAGLDRDDADSAPIPQDELITVPLALVDVAVDRDIAADLRDRAAGRLHTDSARLQRYVEWLDHELRERHQRSMSVVLNELLSPDPPTGIL